MFRSIIELMPSDAGAHRRRRPRRRKYVWTVIREVSPECKSCRAQAETEAAVRRRAAERMVEDAELRAEAGQHAAALASLCEQADILDPR